MSKIFSNRKYASTRVSDKNAYGASAKRVKPHCRI